MNSVMTFRMDKELEAALDRICARTGKSRSEIMRDALKREVALLTFEQLRAQMLPYGEAAGYITDEDVFRDIS